MDQDTLYVVTIQMMIEYENILKLMINIFMGLSLNVFSVLHVYRNNTTCYILFIVCSIYIYIVLIYT